MEGHKKQSSSHNLAKSIREWVALSLAMLGAVLGTIGFLQSRQAADVAWRVEADKLLDDAWDCLGGGKGTDYIGVYVSDPRELEMANRYIDRAKTIAPKYARVYSIGSALAAARGQYDESISLSRKALELDPKASSACNRIGWILTMRQQWPEAAAEFRRAAALDPKNPSAWSNLCFALLQQHKLSEAADACEQALLVDPSYKTAYYNLSAVYRKQGRTKEAQDLDLQASKLKEASRPARP